MTMMPWKEQLRLGWRVFRWAFWPENLRAWANITLLIVFAAMVAAIYAQLWLAWLAGICLGVAVGRAGRKRKPE